jgi:hypothetical protein
MIAPLKMCRVPLPLRCATADQMGFGIDYR